MIAMKTDSLVNDGSVLLGQTGCDTLRNNMADGGADAISSFLVDDGVKKVPIPRSTSRSTRSAS